MRTSINTVREKNLRGVLIVLLFLVFATALGAGYFFIKDPTGTQLGFPLYYIHSSPFSNYYWPGWILFITIGIYGLICFLLVVLRYRYYPFHIMVQGIMLVGWIAVQTIMVRDFNLLNLICIVIGLIFFIAGNILIDKKNGY